MVATSSAEQSDIDPRAVFVVHGRNLLARKAVFEFLRVIDLRPLEWHEVARQTASGSPFVFEILVRAFEIAQAVIIILTPDDEACLRAELRTETGDAKKRLQPRPNVLFEAGMAFMRDRRRTILLEFGSPDMLSDLHGIHTLRVAPGAAGTLRKEIADRLATAGCPVSLQGVDWLSAGNFEAALHNNAADDQLSLSGTLISPITGTAFDTTHGSTASGLDDNKTVMASGSRSVAVGGSVSGKIHTGDRSNS